MSCPRFNIRTSLHAVLWSPHGRDSPSPAKMCGWSTFLAGVTKDPRDEDMSEKFQKLQFKAQLAAEHQGMLPPRSCVTIARLATCATSVD